MAPSPHAEAACAKIAHWRKRPVDFVRENFQVEPDIWQHDALGKLRPHGVNRICLKACAGPGKTAVLAWIGWWWLSCFASPGEHPKGAAVAITSDNLKDNLWAELAKWRNRSAFLQAAFEYQKERIFAKDHPETWFLSARSFSKTADAQEQGRTLSGLHSLYPFVLLDESGDMAPAIGRAAEQAMGNCAAGLVIQAGNPTSSEGLLYDSSTTNRSKWEVVTITADPDDPKRTPRVDITWAKEQIDRYGRDNPWVMAYILGLFPPGNVNSLIGVNEVEAAIGRHLRPDQYEWAPKAIGIDVARFGDDRTALFPRQGLAAFDPIIMRGARTDEIAARAVARGHQWADGYMVDGTGGWGAGVVDCMRRAGFNPHEVNASGKPIDERFFNKRAECWWKMCEWVKGGGALPNVPELVRELTAPTYWLQNGKLRLEEKDQIKSRLGYSPDLADAFSLTFAVELASHLPGMLSGEVQTITSDDPFTY